LKVGKRQFQRKLAEYTNEGRRYKCAFVKKVILYKNKREREDYESGYEDKSVEGFWDYIVFTNEVRLKE